MRGFKSPWMCWVFASGCAVAHDVGEGASAGLNAAIVRSAACQREVADSYNGIPSRLECTGLYTDIATQTLSDQVHEFAPAHPLWSDASVKTRWIYLPEDKTIDGSNPSAWVFPVGTRFWKEFRNAAGDQIIETRLLQKMAEGEWSAATFEWDESQMSAKRLDSGKDIEVDGHPYRLPSGQQCDECHNGRRDRILGFDQVSLGLPESTGYNLAYLLAQKKLKNFKGTTSPQLGPDPESAESRALGWMHTNCGVSCHNNVSSSKAYSNGMRLTLDPDQLDGRSTEEFESVKTTIEQDVFALQWRGNKRIVPGDPENSWLYKLITSRGDPKEQMPPLASNLVDEKHAGYVREWIMSLKTDE